jgi:hypothetical protein
MEEYVIWNKKEFDGLHSERFNFYEFKEGISGNFRTGERAVNGDGQSMKCEIFDRSDCLISAVDSVAKWPRL